MDSTLKTPHSDTRPKFKNRYELKVEAGVYKRNTLFGLVWYVLTHRLGHLIKDGKWMD